MAKTDFKTVDEYIAAQPAEARERLEEIRGIIKRSVPDAKEGISYQIPYYNNGGPVVYFSYFKKHIAVASPPPTMEVFKDQIKDYKSSVSVVQLPHDQPLPKELIAKIAQYKQAENLKKQK